MTKIRQRESGAKGRAVASFLILKGRSLFSSLWTSRSVIYHRSKSVIESRKVISVADVDPVTKHMNFTLKKETSLSSWAQTVSFCYFSEFTCCHIGKMRQSGLVGNPSRGGTRSIYHQIRDKMPFAVTLQCELSSGKQMQCSNRQHNRKDTVLWLQSLFQYIYYPKLTWFIIRDRGKYINAKLNVLPSLKLQSTFVFC